MKIYAISGLGADERVFEFLTINCKFVPISWIIPFKNEKIEQYARRLSMVVDDSENYGLLGVSFGGLIATEISKVLNPAFTILLSSAEIKSELPWIYRFIGKTILIRIIPPQLFDPPRWLAKFLFGTQNTLLLYKILEDTDLNFAKWAVAELLSWENEDRLDNCIKINGTSDKLIPFTETNHTFPIEKGEHFMIVDRATEISNIINNTIAKYEIHRIT